MFDFTSLLLKLFSSNNNSVLKMAEKMGCYHIVDLSTPIKSSHNKTPSVFMVSSNSGCMETLCPARWIDLLEICRNRPTRSDRILYGFEITVCFKVFKNFMEKLPFFQKKIWESSDLSVLHNIFFRTFFDFLEHLLWWIKNINIIFCNCF